MRDEKFFGWFSPLSSAFRRIFKTPLMCTKKKKIISDHFQKPLPNLVQHTSLHFLSSKFVLEFSTCHHQFGCPVWFIALFAVIILSVVVYICVRFFCVEIYIESLYIYICVFRDNGPSALEAIDNDLASYRGPCSAEYDDGVRRLYVLAEPLRSVEKRPTSPRPSAKETSSPYHRGTHPPFARIVWSESMCM